MFDCIAWWLMDWAAWLDYKVWQQRTYTADVLLQRGFLPRVGPDGKTVHIPFCYRYSQRDGWAPERYV